MQINFLGHSCFKIRVKKTTLVTDPYGDYLGFAMTKTKADIVTISHDHPDHNDLSQVKGEPFVIRAPGEYEVSEVSVLGFSTYHDQKKGKKLGKNTVYVIKVAGVTLAHLGDLGQELTEKQLEKINEVDILFIPVGGDHTLGPKQAAKEINRIEPKIVVPMHYRVKGMKESLAKPLKPLSDFLKEMEISSPLKKKKLKVSKTSLPEERKIIVMERK